MRWRLPLGKGRGTDTGPDSEGSDVREGRDEPRSFRESAVLFARDVAVAFLVVALAMGAMFAYTQVWPPIVVVESDSMQHSGDTSFIGVVDTGDLVLVQAVRQTVDVATYVDGRANGHRTYSDFGDVIIFQKPGAPSGSTPIIHRAIAYVYPNASGGANVPSLARLSPDEWAAEANGRPVSVPSGITTFTIRNAGFSGDRDLTFDVSGVKSEGFLTMGDHNMSPDPWGPVPIPRILGRARGELPWFGLIKLTLAPGATGCCPSGWGDPRAPSNSWDALLVSLIAIVAGPFVADFAWSSLKERRERRERGKPGEAEGAANPEPSPDSEGAEATSAETADEEPPEGPTVTDDSRTGSAGPGVGGP